jgi:uncharacterized phiE125 gp8 family phage protein
MLENSLAEPIVTLPEAQAFLRLETGEEEALVAGMIRSASALCEAFLGQVMIARTFTEEISASPEWQRLAVVPVRSIDEVKSGGTMLAVTAYATDIDSNGYGWVRVLDPAVSGRLEVGGSAGVAASQNAVPEPIRHGVLRLVAHLFASRDGDGCETPAAVTALWRPYRRLNFA